MAERGQFRGGGRGRGEGRGRGGGGGDRGGRGGGHAPNSERKKENILDLSKYLEKGITVKFNGGREGMCLSQKRSSSGMLPGTNTWTAYLVTGTLKGFDQLMNLVLDNVKETTRGEQA